MEFARNRIELMDETDLARQVYAIRLSMDAARPPERPPIGDLDPLPYDRDLCLSHARRIGDQLVALAFPATDMTGWVTLCEQGGVWWTEFTQFGLQQSCMGIGLFLAWLADATGQESYRFTASRVLYSMRFEGIALRTSSDLGTWGPDHATGWGGVIGAMGEMARLLDDTVAIEDIEDIAVSLAELEWEETGELVAGFLRSGGPRAATIAARLGTPTHPKIPASTAEHHALMGGRAGRIDALLDAPQRDHAAIEAEAGAWLAELEAGGPRTGVPGGLPGPGLALGLAGIGHGLLRLARPDKVPSAWTGPTRR